MLYVGTASVLLELHNIKKHISKVRPKDITAKATQSVQCLSSNIWPYAWGGAVLFLSFNALCPESSIVCYQNSTW